MDELARLFLVLVLFLLLVSCTSATAGMPTVFIATPTSVATTREISPTSAPTRPPLVTAPPAPTNSPTPEPNVTLVFFYDWDLDDPFNLRGSGLNSRRDDGEVYLSDFEIIYRTKSYKTDSGGRVSLIATAQDFEISVPNRNPYPGIKDLPLLDVQFSSTMYEPYEVDYGSRFRIDLEDDNCFENAGRHICEVGVADGYLTSPYEGQNYIYSSPWTYDAGLDYDEHFIAPLRRGLLRRPGEGGERDAYFFLGEELGGLIADYANISNRGIPYGYPYILNHESLGVYAHMYLDIRNGDQVPVYAPIGGVVCPGNSSDFAICSRDIMVDVNEFRAIPEWEFDLTLRRGQLVGWTDPISNISGHQVAFPQIHMGVARYPDAQLTLHLFPYITAEQLVRAAAWDEDGGLTIPDRLVVTTNYWHRAHLPHAPVHTGR